MVDTNPQIVIDWATGERHEIALANPPIDPKSHWWHIRTKCGLVMVGVPSERVMRAVYADGRMEPLERKGAACQPCGLRVAIPAPGCE